MSTAVRINGVCMGFASLCLLIWCPVLSAVSGKGIKNPQVTKKHNLHVACTVNVFERKNPHNAYIFVYSDSIIHLLHVFLRRV